MERSDSGGPLLYERVRIIGFKLEIPANGVLYRTENVLRISSIPLRWNPWHGMFSSC
jgi:hypothetical protein